MTIGIICEYNPPHKGHAYQLRTVRSLYPDCRIVCVMSGNFVQRGTPAIADKYARAEAAVRLGADAVFELPFPYSTAAAEFFARAGVFLLHALGADAICFGTEGPCREALLSAAQRLCSTEFEEAFRLSAEDRANAGIGYPALRQRVYTELYGPEDDALLRTPNNTLGLEYLRAARVLAPEMDTICIPRTGDAHDADAPAPAPNAILSASAIRARIEKDSTPTPVLPYLPDAAADILCAEAAAGHLCLSPEQMPGYALLHFLRTTEPAALARYAGLGGGLSGRLCAAARQAATQKELFSLAATKKYTHAAIRRAALHGFFGITEEELRTLPRYTVLLAANTDAAAYLRTLHKHCPIPILSRPASYRRCTEEVRSAFVCALAADALWASALPSPISQADLARSVPRMIHP